MLRVHRILLMTMLALFGVASALSSFTAQAGILAWTTSSWLWGKIWRSTDRSGFSSKWAWFAYRLGRNLVMVLTLMGAIGIILLLVQWVISGWQILLAILRIITWPAHKIFSLFSTR